MLSYRFPDDIPKIWGSYEHIAFLRSLPCRYEFILLYSTTYTRRVWRRGGPVIPSKYEYKEKEYRWADRCVIHCVLSHTDRPCTKVYYYENRTMDEDYGYITVEKLD